MRLLTYREDGELVITADLDDGTIPPYAILSHTWGADVEEVSFQDFADNTGKAKLGYEKIRFCGAQAQKDSLRHFWIDTCCIDKTNRAELSKAIKSMFRWYCNAVRCYVYLPDVSSPFLTTEENIDIPRRQSDLRKSRWFTRGWTLQELLAPDSVEFFSKDGVKLGNRASLMPEIFEVTGIPRSALQGNLLSDFSVAERISWIEPRTTTVPVDQAYSLMGILGVSMSPIDGETTAEALKRLTEEVEKQNKCIQDIRLTDPRHDKARIEATKGGLLKDGYRWVLENDSFLQWQNDSQSQLLWVKGDPGKGKTMLLCGIIDELRKSTPKSTLISYFFCQATDSRINSATAVLRGLLYLLVSQQPSLTSHVCKVYDHAGKMLFTDTNAWFAMKEIFTNMLQDSSLNATYLVIDALDECVTDLPKLLDFIAKQSSTPSRVKWIVSSRNWPDIEERLERADHKVRLSLELNAESVSTAVSTFIEQKVSWLAREKKYENKTRAAVLNYLVSNANDTFLWVALVCQSLETTSKRHVLKKLESFPPGLTSLYERMMQQISELDDADICKHILASVALVYRPVTLKELTALVEQLEDTADDLESMEEIISSCGSLLALREETIYFVHQSAKDFLLTKAAEEVFPSGTGSVHYNIFARSLEVMSITLQRDIYGLKTLGSSIDSIQLPDPDPLATSRYSCIYWIDHLCDSNLESSPSSVDVLYDGSILDMFFRKKYLYWLEALSLCKSMSKGIVSVAKLWSLVQGRGGKTAFAKLVEDASRFIIYHKTVIEESPLQVYASALLFSPTKSLVRRLFHHEEPKGITIKLAMRDNWSPCLQTLEGHTGNVAFVAFSHNSTLLASASARSNYGAEKTMFKIWETSSGACLETREDYSDPIAYVAFSHDSTRLMSASLDDRIIKIWDASNGTCLQTLEGHGDNTTDIAFSHDATRLASASDDGLVKIWDISSGMCLQTIESYSQIIIFSHDSTWLASNAHDTIIQIWDTSNGACIQTLRGHGDSIRSVVFSHDSTRLASGSINGTIQIWDIRSGGCLQTIKDLDGSITLIAFSHNSAWIAAAPNKAIQIWDTGSGTCLQTLEGHSDYIRSIVFSHDSSLLASGSGDTTVKLWDPNFVVRPEPFEGHSSLITSMISSPDSTQLASTTSSDDNTLKIWDVSSGTCLLTLENDNSTVECFAFSHDSSQLAASYWGHVKIWNASSGACLQTFDSHCDGALAFSHDSTQLAISSLHGDKIEIWDLNDGVCLRRHIINSHGSVSLAFSHDSTRLALGSAAGSLSWCPSWDSEVMIFDATSGACLHTLRGHDYFVTFVAFSRDSTWLVSAADDKTVRIWDTGSGACLQTFDIGNKLFDISFDLIDSYLSTKMESLVVGASSVTNATTDTEPPYPQYPCGAIGIDGAWIIYNSEKVLWVPSEYRSFRSAVLRKTVGISARSGRVWFCSFEHYQS